MGVSPINFIIISIRKMPKNSKLMYSMIFISFSYEGYPSSAKQIVFSRMQSVINNEKLILKQIFKMQSRNLVNCGSYY